MAQAGQGEHALQVWAQAERVIGDIVARLRQASALMHLGTAMESADEFEQLLHVIQRAWRQVETREGPLALFFIVSVFISRKPEIGIAFNAAFNWVDTFLSGGD